ncbi:MAG: hypothetical protein ACN4GZ_08830 [Acidimicrobiales bacterium]
MTGRTTQTKKPAGRSTAAAARRAKRLDVSAIGGHLAELGDAAEQLERENCMLADSLKEAEAKFSAAKETERASVKAAASAERESAKLRATIQRRETELAELEAELSKHRSERVDWEAMILAERDAVIEEHGAELVRAREEANVLTGRIVELETELAIERQRTAPDARIVELMTTPGTTLLLDGEGLLVTAWPGARPKDRRQQVVDAAARFQKRHGVNVELVLAAVSGWDSEAEYGDGLRIRVPHQGIPISVCLEQLARVHVERSPVVTVSGSIAEEPWISLPRAGALLGLPVSPQFIDLTSTDRAATPDLGSVMEEAK